MTNATILIPTFDHAELIHFAIRSVLRQTESSWELFVVGDGAPDITREIVAQYAQNDQRIFYFENPKGQRHGELHRHSALQKARGKIITYLSDDDLYLPHHLTQMAELLAEADFANTCPISVFPDGELQALPVNLELAGYRNMLLSGKNRIPLSNAGHTIALYQRLPRGWHPAPTNLHTDLHFFQQLLKADGVRVKSGLLPSLIHLPSPYRKNFSPAERKRELEEWEKASSAQGWLESFLPKLRTAELTHLFQVEADATQFKIKNQEIGEIAKLRAQIDELAQKNLDFQEEIRAISRTRIWRLRNFLLRFPLAKLLFKQLSR